MNYDWPNDLIIISVLFAIVLLPRIHKTIEFISENIIFRLTQAATTL